MVFKQESQNPPPRLRGSLSFNEPMARYTSWRVGGPAGRLYQPADVDDLKAFLGTLPEDEPLLWLGLGSNLLVRDGGLAMTVIYTYDGLSKLELVDTLSVRVEAGVACAKLARYCANLGLAGAEFLAGIPGSMGGALAMNAGAFGGETWDLVQTVETIDRAGRCRVRRPDEFSVRYRHVETMREEWFVGAVLRLRPDDPQAIASRIKQMLDKRNDSQPIGKHSCGSVFRNPPGDFAGRLVEQCGLKGYRVGGAVVSERHANFIVNEGNATASDIERLMNDIIAAVKTRTGIELVPEVRVVGTPSATTEPQS